MAVTYEVVLMNRQAMPEQYAEISLNVFHYRDPDCGIRGIHVIRGIRGISLLSRLSFFFVFIRLPVVKGLLSNDLCDGRPRDPERGRMLRITRAANGGAIFRLSG